MIIKVMVVLIIHLIVELGLITTCFKEFNQYKGDYKKLEDVKRTLMAGTITLTISAIEVFITNLTS